MKHTKRWTLALALMLSVTTLFGCGQTQTPKQEEKKTESTAQKDEKKPDAEKKEIELTDQNGRKVKVKYPVERIACLQHHSLDILTQLGVQDKIVCTEDKLEKDLGDYITKLWPAVKDLPRCGTLKEPNVEAIAAQKPDLVLVAAQANKDAVQKMADLGLPVLTITLRGEGEQKEAQNPRLSDADKAYTDGLHWVVDTFGLLTGTEDRAKKLWDFCMESRAMVEKAVGNINDADRVRVFIANENNQTYGNDKYVGCQLLRAGAVNVAAADIQGYKPYNMEQLAKWNPDVIIVQDRYPEVYKQVTTDPQYAELKAVKDGKVIEAPYWTKPWGNPDTDSIALGELWLAHEFYPDKISKDVVLKRAQEFYREFYGTDFTGTVN